MAANIPIPKDSKRHPVATYWHKQFVAASCHLFTGDILTQRLSDLRCDITPDPT